jgi:hypothetical protein
MACYGESFTFLPKTLPQYLHIASSAVATLHIGKRKE